MTESGLHVHYFIVHYKNLADVQAHVVVVADDAQARIATTQSNKYIEGIHNGCYSCSKLLTA